MHYEESIEFSSVSYAIIKQIRMQKFIWEYLLAIFIINYKVITPFWIGINEVYS